MERIAIIGLGLIGGSLGMALKRAASSDVEIIGCDESRKARSRAVKLQAVDRAQGDILKAVRGAQLVVVATPILAMRQVMEAMGPGLDRGCVVTDTGSTKTQIMAWAEEFLPATVDFVGGHPMAGKEMPGIDNADPELFQDATYCIIPSPRASARAIKSVIGLAEGVGATPFFPDPVEHDGLVAAISHLPLISSTALLSATTSSPSWQQMSRLAASGFRDATRLASTDPEMSAGICLTNREAIARCIDRYIEELEGYKRLLSEGEGELQARFAQAREARETWLRGEETEPKGAGRRGSPAGSWLSPGRLMGRMGGVAFNPGRKREPQG
ncbi:MAG: prephenate dehydrogenase [Dehalococcoidia bacterium]